MRLSIITILCVCIQFSDVLSHPQSSSQSGENSWRRLHRAVRAGNENEAERLVDNTNLNAVDESGNSALLIAADRGFDKIAHMLIEKGANVNIVNEDKKSALIIATDRGFDKIAKLLMQNGADVNIVSNRGITALMRAADQGRKPEFEEIVQTLVERGANVNAVNDEDKSALEYAAENGYEEIVKILNQSDKSINDDGDTALGTAATRGSVKAVEQLIKIGANVNKANKYGTTALMKAAKNGNEKIIKLLLQNDATIVNAVDKDGHTALDAVNTATEGHEVLINLLVQHGAEYKGVELYRKTSQEACQLYSNLTSRWQYGTSTRIYDGTLAQIGEFPWMVALGYLNKQNYKVDFSCGGSLISDVFVLTAAHCVKSNRRPIIARLGKITLTDEDEFRAENENIQQIISHPKYSFHTKKNDIALIRLVNRIAFTEFIRPICLQTDLSDVDTGISLTVTGWGQTNSSKTSNDLLKTDLKTMPLYECIVYYLEYNKERNLASFRNGIDESQYCAFDPVGSKDSCQGDSGGPLQTIPLFSGPAKAVGVVSFGVGCGRGKPGIYTRIAHYIEWIGSHAWPNGKIDTPRISIY